jgi:FG-GAP-like repeat
MKAAAITPMLCAMTLALAACNIGSTSSDSAASAPADATGTSGALSGPTGGSMTASIAWADASGPVDGYRVAVSRNGGPATAEFDVSTASATLSANAGDTLVVAVAAFDAAGNLGPYSSPSNPIVFANDGSVYVQRSSTPVNQAVAASTTSATSADTTSSTSVATVMPGDKTRFDFDGDRASDMLWEAPAPDLALHITRFVAGTLATGLDFDRPTNDWLVVTADDFDGDGQADILWENTAGSLAFSAASRLYEVAPTVPLSVMGALGSNEVVVATGDFNADGRADLLVRDDSSGTRSLWMTDADGIGQRVGLGVSIAAGSSAVRVGDFDGDGRSDIVWRGADGAISVTFMDGASATASLEVPSCFGHEILASGDFDGDGADDLVHSDPATGAVGVLLMSARSQPVAWTSAVDPGLGWGVAAAGDYDADGRADLLWESEAGRLLGLNPAGSTGAVFVSIDAGGNWILVADQ